MKQLVGRAISSRLPLGVGRGWTRLCQAARRRRVARRGGRQLGVRDQSSFRYSLEEGNRAGPSLAVCSLRPEDPAALKQPSGLPQVLPVTLKCAFYRMRGVGLREAEGPKAPCQRACDQEPSDLCLFPCIPSFPGTSLILRQNRQCIVPARLFQTLALGAKHPPCLVPRFPLL